MGKILDGLGRGNEVEVNDERELVVRAITEPEIEHASGKLGSAYSWVSANTDININDTRLFVKNTGDTPLIMDSATFLPAATVAEYTINLGRATTTPTGTVITGVNLNATSGNVADATAFDDETAVADGDPIMWIHTLPLATGPTLIVSLVGIILGKNSYIQVNFETEETAGRVVLIGHFENPS